MKKSAAFQLLKFPQSTARVAGAMKSGELRDAIEHLSSLHADHHGAFAVLAGLINDTYWRCDRSNPGGAA